MQVRVLGSFSLGGGRDAKVGEVLDLPVPRCIALLYSGLAESVEGPASPDVAPTTAPGPDVLDHPEGAAESYVTRDPRPIKPARGQKEK